MMHGHVARFRARLDAATGHLESVEPSFRRAEEIYGERSLVFLLASTQLEHAEWLVGQGRPDEAEPLLTEARQTFERLEAAPWLERAGGQAVPEAAAAGA
jgi:hypothetical protein